MQYSVDAWMVHGKNIGWRTVGKTHDVIQFYRGFRRKNCDPFGPTLGGMYDCDCFQEASQFAIELSGGIQAWLEQANRSRDNGRQ